MVFSLERFHSCHDVWSGLAQHKVLRSAWIGSTDQESLEFFEWTGKEFRPERYLLNPTQLQDLQQGFLCLIVGLTIVPGWGFFWLHPHYYDLRVVSATHSHRGNRPP